MSGFSGMGGDGEELNLRMKEFGQIRLVTCLLTPHSGRVLAGSFGIGLRVVIYRLF